MRMIPFAAPRGSARLLQIPEVGVAGVGPNACCRETAFMVRLKGCHALTNTDRLHRVEERHDGHFAGHLLADRLDELESLRRGEGVLEALDEGFELWVVVPAAPAGPSRLGARRPPRDLVL